MRGILVAAGLSVFLCAPRAQGTGESRQWRELRLPPAPLAVDHLGAEGGEPRLVVATAGGLATIDAEGRTRARLDRDGSRVWAWTAARGKRGRVVVCVADGGRVLEWAGGREPARELFRDGEAVLPGGVLWARIAADVTGDGRYEVLLPSRRGVRIWRRGEEGWRLWIDGRHGVEIDVDVGSPDEPAPEARRSLRVPSVEARDLNGDGVPDLAFDDGERIRFHWSVGGRPPGPEPTFELDLEAIRRRLGEGRENLFEASNLLSALEQAVTYEVEDFDGDGFADLLLRRGNKVTVYRGDATGVDRSRAAQVLRTGGNLIHAAAFDEDGDGRADLSLLVAQDVGVTDVLRWLVVGGEIELRLYTYRQEAPLRFARKPSRRRTLRVELPALRSLAAEVEEQLERSRLDWLRFPVIGDFDGDRVEDDVGLVRDGRLEVHRDAAPGGYDWSGTSAWRAVVERFDRRADSDGVAEVPLSDLFDWAPLPGRELVERTRGRTPSLSVPLPPGGDEVRLWALDLGGGPTDDVVVAVSQRESDEAGEAPPPGFRLFVLFDPATR